MRLNSKSDLLKVLGCLLDCGWLYYYVEELGQENKRKPDNNWSLSFLQFFSLLLEIICISPTYKSMAKDDLADVLIDLGKVIFIKDGMPFVRLNFISPLTWLIFKNRFGGNKNQIDVTFRQSPMFHKCL